MIKYLSVIVLLFFSACRYQDHVVQINTNLSDSIKYNQNYNKELYLKVFDSRLNKEFIGFRAPVSIWNFKEQYKDPNFFGHKYKDGYYFKLANIINNQDLSVVIQEKLTKNLTQKGLKLRRFSGNLLKVEILELSIVSTMYRVFVDSKIKITATNKYNNLEKIYKKRIVSYGPALNTLLFGPFYFGPKGSYYDNITNECLDENLKQIINDNQIWNFLSDY